MRFRYGVTAALTPLIVGISGEGALAHHAFQAQGDCAAPIVLSGHVTVVEWTNPHVWVHVLVTEPGKAPQDWMFGGASPNTVRRLGLTEAIIKPGEAVTVYGWKAKDQRCQAAVATGKPTCKAEGHMLSLVGAPPVVFGDSGGGPPSPPAAWPAPAPEPQRLDAAGRPLIVAGTYLKSDGSAAPGESSPAGCARAPG